MFTAEKNDTSVPNLASPSVHPGLFMHWDTATDIIRFAPNVYTHMDCISLDEFHSFLDEQSVAALNVSKDREQSSFVLAFTSDKISPDEFLCTSSNNKTSVLITGVPVIRSHSNTDEIDALKKEMEEFAYIASHDLQEPLRKVSTYVERLMDNLPEPEKDSLKVYTDRITVSLANMRNLIDDLLQFARSAKQPQTVEKIDLNDLIQRTLLDNELKIEETKAKIYLQPLPTIEGDASQLLQVFNNLITNAIKFVKPDEHPVLYIYTEELNAEDRKKASDLNTAYIKLCFRDEGIGFDKQFTDKIFQMFHRLNPKHAYKGSGIGLAICKKIITNHNGFITADSNGKQGSVFSVILPEKQKHHG